ncbi:MAG: hypothetical protein EI684_08325 [Candidatus Viridilinea halotolerans]|uniref:ORC1/DEAH AAA+ ATPase domain-containing protein n=1 Tax=Candidatus Viridilinea halotolerans TaxID=2491704 RepID=A0A426U2E3_9CHLR|nr:MAG: hypothetical protein EI684_08325 [Candidatus Viridilinea halotolerans]
MRPLIATLATWQRVLAETLAQAEAASRASGHLANPFRSAGNPLDPRTSDDTALFKGRASLFRQLEGILSDAGRRPPPLLVGGRRNGKTSILRFLPTRLSSRIAPAFVSLQKPADGLIGLLGRLADAITAELQRTPGLGVPPLLDRKQLQQDAFAAFGVWMDALERWLDQRVLLLAIDEYEALEEGMGRGCYDERILALLRSLIQDRRQIAVLLSGVHELDELAPIWASRLINTVPLRVGFLVEDDARALLREPAPAFPPATLAAVSDTLLARTHCQPYLLQVYAYSLVEHLNETGRRSATEADVAAVEELVLTRATSYFSDQWRTESGGPLGEQLLAALAQRGPMDAEALRALVSDEANFTRTLKRMTRRTIVIRDATSRRYTISIPLLATYIRRESAL